MITALTPKFDFQATLGRTGAPDAASEALNGSLMAFYRESEPHFCPGRHPNGVTS